MRRIWRRKVFTMTNVEATTSENTAAVAGQSATVAPEKASSKKAATQKKGAPKGHKAAKKATPKKPAKTPSKKASKPAARKKTSGARAGGKKAEVIAMLQRKSGATLDEIAKATGWQHHTVRGFISLLGSKGGMKITSTRREDGARVYEA